MWKSAPGSPPPYSSLQRRGEPGNEATYVYLAHKCTVSLLIFQQDGSGSSSQGQALLQRELALASNSYYNCVVHVKPTNYPHGACVQEVTSFNYLNYFN